MVTEPSSSRVAKNEEHVGVRMVCHLGQSTLEFLEVASKSRSRIMTDVWAIITDRLKKGNQSDVVPSNERIKEDKTNAVIVQNAQEFFNLFKSKGRHEDDTKKAMVTVLSALMSCEFGKASILPFGTNLPVIAMEKDEVNEMKFTTRCNFILRATYSVQKKH